MWTISMHTRLGHRSLLKDQVQLYTSLLGKTQMNEAIKSRSWDEAVARDVGFLPGDRLGAVRLDSGLWVHLKRNWVWSKRVKKISDVTPSQKASNLRKKRLEQVPLKPIRLDELLEMKSEYRANLISSSAKGKKKKKKVKILSNPTLTVKKKVRKVYYDKIDRSILKRIKKTRADWSEIEDNILHLCKMASLFLFPNPRKNFVPLTVVRDVFHRLCPVGRNKTSRACQRRLVFLSHSKETQEALTAGAANLNNNLFIRRYVILLACRVFCFCAIST